MIFRLRAIFAVGLVAFVLSGCVRMRDVITLNPDGSGKILVKRWTPLQMNMGSSGKDVVPGAEAKKAAKKLIEKSKGIEAWKDVSWKVDAEGYLYVTGTAYFKNLNDLKIGGSQSEVKIMRNEAGEMVLGLKKKSKKNAKNGKPASTPKKRTAQEMERAILIEKMKWQQAKPLLYASFHGMESRTVVRVPGTIKKAAGFKKDAAGTSASLAFKGDDILKIFESVTTDEAFWARRAKEGGADFKEMEDPEVMEKLFGTRDRPEMTITKKATPLFDFAKEVAAAKLAHGKLIKSLDITMAKASGGSGGSDAPVTAAIDGAALKEAWVEGLSFEHHPDVKEVHFWGKPGCELKILGRLPGKVLKIEGGVLERAVTDSGLEVLPKEENDRKVKSARISGKKKGFVRFTVRTTMPAAADKTFTEVAGHLIYFVGTGTKTDDLGVILLKKDAVGKALNAKLKSGEPGKKQFSIEFDAEVVEMVKKVAVMDEKGVALKVKPWGSHGWNKRATFTFLADEKLPEKIKIKVYSFEKMESRKMPFLIKNVSMRGK